MGKAKAARIIAYLFALIFLLSVPFFIKSQYYLQIIILGGVYSILALGLNVVVGFAGQLALCQAAFYSIGAYSSALLVMKLGFPFWVALPSAALISAFLGAILGLTALRTKGHYLAIVTLGFGIIVYQIIMNWISLTRGPMALTGIPRPEPINFFGLFLIDFNSRSSHYYLILALTIFTVATIKRIRDSRVGDAFLAIREDEISAQVLGINTFKYKVIAFSLSAFYAGLAGSFLAHYMTMISPEMFTFLETATIFLIMIVGGFGSIYGIVFSAVLLTMAPEYLRVLEKYRMVTYGALVVVIIILLPEGLAGGVRRLTSYIQTRYLLGKASLN